MSGFPGGLDGKVSAYNAGDPASIPGSGRSSGEGNGTPLQYSCLENLMDWGAWWAIVHGVAKSRTRLRDFTSLHVVYLKLILYVNYSSIKSKITLEQKCYWKQILNSGHLSNSSKEGNSCIMYDFKIHISFFHLQLGSLSNTLFASLSLWPLFIQMDLCRGQLPNCTITMVIPQGLFLNWKWISNKLELEGEEILTFYNAR